MKLKIYVLIGVLLIVAGFIINSPNFVNFFEAENSTPFLTPAQVTQIEKEKNSSKKPTISGIPTYLTIPSVNIAVNVDPGVYYPKTQTWSLSLTDAEYATITPPANNLSGNTFIYGHNRWAVFYKLLKINIGDEAIVNTANGHTFTYKLVAEKVTQPNDLSLFKYKGPPILTLQTCSGDFYQNRQFFIFNLVSAT